MFNIISKLHNLCDMVDILTKVKSYLGIDDTNTTQDQEVQQMINVAIETIETAQQKTVIPAKYEQLHMISDAVNNIRSVDNCDYFTIFNNTTMEIKLIYDQVAQVHEVTGILESNMPDIEQKSIHDSVTHNVIPLEYQIYHKSNNIIIAVKLRKNISVVRIRYTAGAQKVSDFTIMLIELIVADIYRNNNLSNIVLADSRTKPITGSLNDLIQIGKRIKLV